MSAGKLVISRIANDDLHDIWEVISEVDGNKADEIIDLLFEQCQLLLTTPGMGRARDELRAGVRSWPIKSWVIFYRVVADNVEVIRVLHARQETSNIF